MSTFYRRIAGLEQQSGQLCLKRGPGGATLTDFGRSLAQVRSRTRSGLNQVLSELRSREQQIEGEVSLTTVVAPSRCFKARSPSSPRGTRSCRWPSTWAMTGRRCASGRCPRP